MADNPDILVGKGKVSDTLLLRLANRHGLVAGATGTGKTVTLQVMAEGFSRAGVPVFAADVKGDLSGIAAAGEEGPVANAVGEGAPILDPIPEDPRPSELALTIKEFAQFPRSEPFPATTDPRLCAGRGSTTWVTSRTARTGCTRRTSTARCTS